MPKTITKVQREQAHGNEDTSDRNKYDSKDSTISAITIGWATPHDVIGFGFLKALWRRLCLLRGQIRRQSRGGEKTGKVEGTANTALRLLSTV